MELDRNAKFAGNVKYAFDLIGVKGNAFTEPVNRISQSFCVGGAQGGDADLVNIAIGFALEFGRGRMGAKESGFDPDRTQCRDFAGRTQHVEFGISIKAIARFDFDNRYPFGQKGINPWQRGFYKLVHIGLAGGGDG